MKHFGMISYTKLISIFSHAYFPDYSLIFIVSISDKLEVTLTAIHKKPCKLLLLFKITLTTAFLKKWGGGGLHYHLLQGKEMLSLIGRKDF